MFDFAQSLNQKRKPTKRLFASAVISCLVHILFLIVLLENPWLLEGGVYRHFPGLLLSSDGLPQKDEFELEDYRTITVLKPMAAPSAEILNKYIYDWDRERPPVEEPAIPVRWGDEDDAAPDEDLKITSIVSTEPEPSPAGNEDASELSGNRGENTPQPGRTSGGTSSETSVNTPETAVEMEGAAPVPDASIIEDVALNIAPDVIPDGIPKSEPDNTPQNNGATEKINFFEDEEQAINQPGGGIFDAPPGFPLGDYARRIKKRVTENWFIPSNLRNSKGHTTIVFFIDRSGQHYDARIVESSGNASLNITALNAIISSNPFPPLPQGFPGDHIGVKYVFIPDPQ